jgi:hypothetical protein
MGKSNVRQTSPFPGACWRSSIQQAKDKAVQTAKNAADASASAASMTSFAAFACYCWVGLLPPCNITDDVILQYLQEHEPTGASR